MFKKMLIASLSLSIFSSVSHAGGGAPSYHPSVEPINCVMSSSSNQSFFWNNTEACNQVVDSNFAKGVYYKGTFKYNDGSESGFSGLIGPNNGYAPSHPAGKKVVALLNTSATWVN